MLIVRVVFIFVFGLVAAGSLCAQATPNDSLPLPTLQTEEKESLPRNMREMRQRQLQDREKKQHEEMLKRGETAAEIASELFEAVEKKEQLSATDHKKLDDLEKLVTRIRKDLGGNNDGLTLEEDEEIEKPSNLTQAVTFLKDATEELLGELKKTTRFSISAVAIRSSNTVIRVARFLKLRR
ncbi:MAG: hypothetical protein KF685_01045 [Acidobacteria bacterium]|nr:hypothetical protein [Acidobacteriota bacterium]